MCTCTRATGRRSRLCVLLFFHAGAAKGRLRRPPGPPGHDAGCPREDYVFRHPTPSIALEPIGFSSAHLLHHAQEGHARAPPRLVTEEAKILSVAEAKKLGQLRAPEDAKTRSRPALARRVHFANRSVSRVVCYDCAWTMF